MKKLIMFPFMGIYKYTIKIHENFRVDEELAIIMKIGLIIASLIIFVDPMTVTILLVGNLLNIPLVLYLGGKGDMWKNITDINKVNYDEAELSQIDKGTLEINTGGLNTKEVKTINKKYFNENQNILNKMSSVLRFGLIDGLKALFKNPKGFFEAGLTRLFMEDDIEYIKPDIFEDEEGNVVDLKPEDIVESLNQKDDYTSNIEDDINGAIAEEDINSPIDMSNYEEMYHQELGNESPKNEEYSNNPDDYKDESMMELLYGDRSSNNEDIGQENTLDGYYDNENSDEGLSMLEKFGSNLDDTEN